MELVGSTAGGETQDSTARVGLGGRGGGGERSLLNRFRRHRQFPPRIQPRSRLQIQSVHLKFIRESLTAINESVERITRCARRQENESNRGPSSLCGQRKIRHRFGRDGSANLRGFGFQHGRRARHLHRLRDGADLQREVHANDRTQRDHDIIPNCALEAGLLDRHPVRPGT